MISLIKSTFYNEPETKKRLAEFILSADKLSFGEQCEMFEQRFAQYQVRNDCVFFNSGSSANLALIQALLNLNLLKRGDAVGFSALTWATNVMPLIQLGLQPIPVDVETDTLNISSRTLRQTPNVETLDAFFITNTLGLCDDIDKIEQLCKEYDILFIEDNCESLGTVYQKKKLGNFGLASTFSFYVGHHLSTIEGGAVCTNDAELANMLRMVRAHGWDRNLEASEQHRLRSQHNMSDFYAKYTFYDLGYNLRPNEIQGFIGNLQIDYADAIVKKRNQHFLTIVPSINNDVDRYFPIRHNHIDLLSSFAIPVVCRSSTDRDNLIQRCHDNIETRPIIGGDMTSQPFYKKYINNKDPVSPMSNAALIHQQGFYFGNNPDLTEKEIQTINEVLTQEL